MGKEVRKNRLRTKESSIPFGYYYPMEWSFYLPDTAIPYGEQQFLMRISLFVFICALLAPSLLTYYYQAIQMKINE